MMKKRNNWQRRAMRQFLLGMGAFSVATVFFGCSPADSPIPQEELPIPQEEPVSPP